MAIEVKAVHSAVLCLASLVAFAAAIWLVSYSLYGATLWAGFAALLLLFMLFRETAHQLAHTAACRLYGFKADQIRILVRFVGASMRFSATGSSNLDGLSTVGAAGIFADNLVVAALYIYFRSNFYYQLGTNNTVASHLLLAFIGPMVLAVAAMSLEVRGKDAEAYMMSKAMLGAKLDCGTRRKRDVFLDHALGRASLSGCEIKPNGPKSLTARISDECIMQYSGTAESFKTLLVYLEGLPRGITIN